MCTRTFKKVTVRRNQMRCNFQSLTSDQGAKVPTDAGENAGGAPKGGWEMPRSNNGHWHLGLLQVKPTPSSTTYFLHTHTISLPCFRFSPWTSSSGIFSGRSVETGAGGRTWDSTCTPTATPGEPKTAKEKVHDFQGEQLSTVDPGARTVARHLALRIITWQLAGHSWLNLCFWLD